MNAIEVDSVSKSFSTKTVLDQVCLNVRQHEVYTLLGANGAGKSTLISLMLGLRQPDQGSIRIFGQQPTALAVRQQLGVMLQDAVMPNNLRVKEILQLMRQSYTQPAPLDDVIAMADLQNETNLMASGLSGGQRKRLSFALALLPNPNLLFLDEPTAAMDVEARREFWNTIQALVAQKKTIVLTTHHLEEADAISNTIGVLVGGKIVKEGTPAQIKSATSGKMIRFELSASVPWLPPQGVGVTGHQQHGERHTVYATTAEPLLETLFKANVPISNLEVSSKGLEQAFIDIIEQNKQ